MRRGACDPLKNPEHDQVFSYIDNFIDLNKHLIPDRHRKALRGEKQQMEPLRISQVIASCHRNESIFDVLRFGNEVNIDNIREFPKQFEIEKKLNDLAESVRIAAPVKILSDDARRQLNELSKSQLNEFARYKYDDNLILTITKYDLNLVADRWVARCTINCGNLIQLNFIYRLKLAAERIPPRYKSVKLKLENQGKHFGFVCLPKHANRYLFTHFPSSFSELHLRTYQANLVVPLYNGTKRLLELADKLDNLLLFKQSSFEKAIKMLIREIDNAERFLNEDGTDYIQKAVHGLADSFTRDINGYLDHVINTTKSDVGRCEPLSNVYNATIVNICNRVVDPFVSLNWIFAGYFECEF